MKMSPFHCTISSLRVRVKRKWKCLSAKSKQWHCMAYCCEKYVSLFTIEEPLHPTYHFTLHSFQESSLKPQCLIIKPGSNTKFPAQALQYKQ